MTWKAILLACAILVIGAIDYATGPDIGFSLFYLVPVAWGSWRLARPYAISLALLAAASWAAADFAFHGVNAVSVWNSFTRLGMYVALAALTSRVRDDQQQLRALNDQLQGLLTEERHLARTDRLTSLPN